MLRCSRRLLFVRVGTRCPLGIPHHCVSSCIKPPPAVVKIVVQAATGRAVGLAFTTIFTTLPKPRPVDHRRPLPPVHALGHLLDELGAERRQVVGLAAGYQACVHDDLLVHPFRSGVAQVRLQGRPGRHAAAAYDVGLDRGPRPVADDADGLAGVEERADERDRSLSARSRSGFLVPPGNTRPSYASGFAAAAVRSTWNVSPLSSWLKPWIRPDFERDELRFPPASWRRARARSTPPARRRRWRGMRWSCRRDCRPWLTSSNDVSLSSRYPAAAG